MNRKKLKRPLAALAAALLLTGVAATGLLYGADNILSDQLYQSPKALSGDIVVIGIDQQALEDIGPYQTWSRDVMARAIEALNADEDSRPAAIGIDVLYVGSSSEPDTDAWLTEAASQYGNVVTAAAATFGSQLVTQNDGSFYMDDFTVLAYDEPFDALKAVTTPGHINAMFDSDGIMRHMMLYIDPPEQERAYSFAWELYQKWTDFHGISPNAQPITDVKGRWYLPFSAMPGDYYDGVSISNLLAGEVPTDYFAGKIVLIGPYAAGLQDAYPTAIEHAQNMYGVEIQANTIETMMVGAYKSEISDSLQLVVLFLFSFLCLLWFWNRKLLPATVAWLLVCAAWIGLCLILYFSGHILHVLWIPFAATVLYLVTVAFNYIRATMEKRRISNTFRRYVAPEIVTELLREGTDSLGLGGKLTDIAVLFVDIRGFTTMSELLTPPQVVEILNEYLTLTTKCIMNNHGTLDKFVGDCTMALWNAPLPQQDYIYNAVKTACDMVEGSKALSAQLQEQFGRTVSFGIGVNCGPAVVGNIGAEMRMDFTAIGDTVNTAARLEANAPGGQIYISRAVADALEGRIRVTSLGDSIRLKGKAEGFEILRVDGLMEHPLRVE
ncbi:MAG: adenylate/guanylate cyclase domain-containing protein [Clostridia bacterium]|nr:adenylate/guanylate cyclase domain-containing protein [Clostridia bacterium]